MSSTSTAERRVIELTPSCRQNAKYIRVYMGCERSSGVCRATVVCVCQFFISLPQRAANHLPSNSILTSCVSPLLAVCGPEGVDTAARGTLARLGSAAITRSSDAGPCRVQEIRSGHRASGGVGHRTDKLSGGAAGSCRGGGSRRWDCALGLHCKPVECTSSPGIVFSTTMNDGENVGSACFDSFFQIRLTRGVFELFLFGVNRGIYIYP